MKIKKLINKVTNNKKVVTLILLFILGISLLIFGFNKNTDIVTIDDVSLNNIDNKSKMFAIMISENDGSDYHECDNEICNNSIFPGIAYIYQRAECLDDKGAMEDNVLTFDSNTRQATVKSSKTLYCTLYFNKDTKVPVLNNFYINNQDITKYTNLNQVTIHMAWSDNDVKEYCVTNENNTSKCTWNPTGEGLQKDDIIYTLTQTGLNTLYGFIKDNADNESQSKSDSITYDNVIPSITVNEIDGTRATDITETSANIIVVANDDISGVKQYCYSTPNADSGYTCKDYVSNATIELTSLQPGTAYTVYIYVVDNAGNSSIGSKTQVKFTTNKKSSDVVIDNATGQIQSSPVEGDTLRRFQGSNDTVLNNYICFGTSYKNTCTSTDGQNKYMYRIIGVDTQTNQLKIIKKEALDTTYQWHNTYGSDSYTWNNVDLFKNLNTNSNSFLNNKTYVPDTPTVQNTSTKWSDVIETHTWSFADVPSSSSGVDSSTTASTVLTNEKNAWANGSNKGTVAAKIGLMYVSDYYLAKGNDAKCWISSDGCTTNNWLFIDLNDSNPPSHYEWTMSRYDGSLAWRVSYYGYVGSNTLDFTSAVRPVFYLKSTIVLEGTGIASDPYRIVDAAPTIEKVEVTNDNKTSFTVKVTADSYATKYCYKLDTEHDYKCTKSNTNEFTNVDANTNYTISVYVENKNGLRSEVKETFRIPIGNKVVEYSDHGNGGYGASGVQDDPLVKRFYGEDPNNYICFGADSCSNNDEHMYRIIGVTSDGKLKIMKQTKLSSTQYWHTTTRVTWEGAKLRSDINDKLFYNDTNLVPSDYKQYIDPNPQWCIGDVTSYTTGSAVLQKEMANNSCKEISNSPISLANLSDHYFAYKDGKGGQNCNSSPYCKSWMTYTETQWTMSRNRSDYTWGVDYNGYVYGSYMYNSAYAVRPVFYLISTVKLSGSGSNTDPFIITGLAS